MSKTINIKPEIIYFEDRKEACNDACNTLLSECLIFEKENKNNPGRLNIVRLVKICSETCGELISDGCSAINLLQDCAKACDELVNECGNHDVKHCLAIDESCRQCRDLCNALKNATIWIIIKAKYNTACV